MTPRLTIEQREAIRLHVGPVPVEDEQTRQVYFIVDRATLEALRQDADREAIRKGISDMEAGRVLTLAQLDERIRERLGLRTSA